MLEDITFKALQEVQKQFLVSFSLHLFQWKDVIEILQKDIDAQKQFLDITINHPKLKQYPIKTKYQKLFLKHIICKLEDCKCDIIDELYNCYCMLLSKEQKLEQKSHYRHYILPANASVNSIILQESTQLLSSGTTGLSSWQAGVVLAEWCLSHQTEFDKQCVIELGSGCGLTGLVTAATTSASHVLLTDGHEAVIEQLCLNVKNNETASLTQCDMGEHMASFVGNTKVSVLHLPWHQIPNNNHLPAPDILLAADVVFDPSTFEELKNSIVYLLSLKPEKSRAILACTLRNGDTLNNFLQLLKSNRLTVTQEDEPEKVFYYDRSFPVYIYSLQLSRETS